MGFRILDQSPQFFNASGTQLLVGGTVTFYSSGTATLKDTYTDPTLTAANDNPLVINSQGRVSDIWGNANYRMIVADALGAIQWTMDNVQGPAALPNVAGNSGSFLSTDGVNLLWMPIVQLPSQTGNAGKMLTTNGTDPMWSPQPVLPTFPTTGGSLQVGAILMQWGSNSAPSTNTSTTSKSVTFPTAFSALYHVDACASNDYNLTSVGYIPITDCAGRSVSGFKFNVDTNFGDGSSSGYVTNAVPFTWFAIGAA